jgi:predicted  nucleic acid-binding Zn-ribbon protein
MIEFNDIDFGKHKLEEVPPMHDCHHHPCPPPFDPELKRVFDLAAHADRIAHKALEVAGFANLDASSAKKLSEQTLAILNKVSSLANKADTKSNRALTEIDILKDEVEEIFTKLSNIVKGAGLATDGSYVKNESANYISTATSLADADNKLDAAIKDANDLITSLQNAITALETSVENLSNELEQVDSVQDNIIEAVGLKSDGQYQKSQNSIIRAASNVLEATTKLAEKIQEVEEEAGSSADAIEDIQESIEELEENVSNNTAAIGNLNTRVTNEVNTLNTRITNEVSTLNTKITNVNNKATQLEGRLDLVEPAVNTNHTLIEGAVTRISGLEGRLDVAEGDINSLRLDVDENASDIEGLQNDISDINDVLEGIELEHTSDLLYTLKVNGTSAGTINIPKDQFLSQVSYNQNTKVLTFTFEDGTHTDINISDLVDEYNAGNGISIANHRVNVVIDAASEKGLNASGSGFLSVGPTGLAIHGIIDEIDRAYVAGPGLQRSNVRNSENEWVLSAKIEQNSADVLHATNDGLGVNIQAIGSKLDFSALAGNHLAYNPSTKKLEVDVASLVADPAFVSAVTNIVVTNPAFTNAINDAVEASLLWQVNPNDSNSIQPKNSKNVYVDGTVEATGAIYSGQNTNP